MTTEKSAPIDEGAERARLRQLSTSQLFVLKGLVESVLEEQKADYAAGLAMFKSARKPKAEPTTNANGGKRKPRRALNTESPAANADQG